MTTFQNCPSLSITGHHWPSLGITVHRMSTDCPRTRLARMPSTRTARLGQSTGRSQSARKGRGQGETGKQLNQGLLLHNQRRAQVGSREHERSHNKQKRHLPSKRRTLRTSSSQNGREGSGQVETGKQPNQRSPLKKRHPAGRPAGHLAGHVSKHPAK